MHFTCFPYPQWADPCWDRSHRYRICHLDCPKLNQCQCHQQIVFPFLHDWLITRCCERSLEIVSISANLSYCKGAKVHHTTLPWYTTQCLPPADLYLPCSSFAEHHSKWHILLLYKIGQVSLSVTLLHWQLLLCCHLRNVNESMLNFWKCSYKALMASLHVFDKLWNNMGIFLHNIQLNLCPLLWWSR